MLVDTHCHVLSEYYNDIEDIINRSKESNVGMIIVNGIDGKSNHEVLDLVSKYDIVYGAIGIQPEAVDNIIEEDFKFIESDYY